jgi:hypothetical protein
MENELARVRLCTTELGVMRSNWFQKAMMRSLAGVNAINICRSQLDGRPVSEASVPIKAPEGDIFTMSPPPENTVEVYIHPAVSIANACTQPTNALLPELSGITVVVW